MYFAYSFFANSSTTVDFPTRLAPSINKAVLPSEFSFHSLILLYILRLNINDTSLINLLYPKIAFISMRIYPKIALEKLMKPPKIAMEKYLKPPKIAK